MTQQMSDAIRIVPMRLPEAGAPPTAAPQLTYRGGPIISAVSVAIVYWGDAWSTPPLGDTRSALDAFFDYIVASPLIDQLTEYDTLSTIIGPGRRAASTIAAGAPPATVTDADVRAALAAQILSGAVPKPDVDALYFIYLPPNASVTNFGSASCQSFCGYHDVIAPATYYAVMPYPNCSGCNAGFTELEALTIVSSHELCEAITDPVPGSGWYDDANGEIGDICAWKVKTLGGYQVQQEWSNAANACV
ncbi:MAG TPA: hypothetical protein VN934_06160 [Candidatus Tumulicola sp.]|nr:hypothetical protein [Candidatus Tumulicola sp.]